MEGKAKIKVIGKRRTKNFLSPLESFRRAVILQKQMERMNPFPRPRGFICKFKTYKAYALWREEQENPRLW